MTAKNRFRLISFLAWLIVSILYVLLSEILTKFLFPNVHDVVIWLIVVKAGIVLIFIISVIFYRIGIRKRE